jgi:two-component system, NtrC family, response regulator HydG
MIRASQSVEEQMEPEPEVHSMLGASPVMQGVLRLIERVAATDASVLLTGESGSGKELAARLIHQGSARRRGPFIAVDCGDMAPGLLAPNGFERARGGTLWFDELTEMPLDTQTRLLRVLAARRVRDETDGGCTVRVIASTNRCPLQSVQTGQLREELLYRLAVFPIEMPPLRARGGDVELLAGHFLAQLNAQSRAQKRFSARARMTLKQHGWPGNVRELKNCIERAFIAGDTVLELAPLIQGGAHGEDPSDRERLNIRVGSRIYDMERSLIEATLEHFEGNKRRAADALGCSLKTLYNKLNGYSQRQECARP